MLHALGISYNVILRPSGTDNALLRFTIASQANPRKSDEPKR